MHETTKVFNTHGIVVQRMIDKVVGSAKTDHLDFVSISGGVGGILEGSLEGLKVTKGFQMSGCQRVSGLPTTQGFWLELVFQCQY